MAYFVKSLIEVEINLKSSSSVYIKGTKTKLSMFLKLCIKETKRNERRTKRKNKICVNFLYI